MKFGHVVRNVGCVSRVRRLTSMMSAAALALFVALATPAHAATFYAANNGADATLCGVYVINGTNCGSKASPCRSIQCAIAYAQAGDTVVVGPGFYGDVGRDGNLGESGDDVGNPACSCMLKIEKPVIVVSSDGAGATIIDAEEFDLGQTVRIFATGAEFGRPGKGFTVTSTHAGGNGIQIENADVMVRGNQVVGQRALPIPGGARGTGIATVDGSGIILIEANQVIGGWNTGIVLLGTNKTVRRNRVSKNGSGIFQGGSGGQATITGNILSDNASDGISAGGNVTIVGNGVYGNGLSGDGIRVGSVFSGVIQKNNIYGSSLCGLRNEGASGLLATQNYWGSTTGPGPDPADDVCDGSGGTTISTPFATAPYTVRPPIKP